MSPPARRCASSSCPTSARASPRARSSSGWSPSATRSPSTSRCARWRRPRPPSSCPRRTPARSSSCSSTPARWSTSARRSSRSTSAGGAVPPPAPPAEPSAAAAEAEPAAGLIGGPAPGGRTAVLVGYGPRTTEAKRRPRRVAVAERDDRPAAGDRRRGRPAGAGVAPLLPTAPDARTKPVRHGGLEVGRQAEAHALRGDAATAHGVAHGRGRLRPLAKPPVRKYAKDLGVDLTTVTGSGDGGVITRADVDAAASGTAEAAAAPAPVRAFGTESRGRASSGSRSRACASTPPPRWWPAPSPPRTSRSS